MTEIYTAPVIPSKWDIIPIHTSDVGSYLRCRRYWDWSSPTRNNLRHRVSMFGINTNLWFGSGIHYALECYYNPVLKRDPVEAFQTWFYIQWNGGTVTQDWLERSYDPNPQQITSVDDTIDMLWKIQGLQDLHPDPDESEFMKFRELGIGMMTYYRDYYAPKYDDFQIIAAETKFSIPLGFEARDIREDSPNYNKMLEVHARGQRDAIVQSLITNRYGIYDHKTAAKIDEDYFLKLEKDPQLSNYCWASTKEAQMHGLPWTQIDFAVCNALRKNYPKPPTMTTRGLPSLDRANEGTTAELFVECIRENNLQVWVDSNEKAQSYYNYLVSDADKLFVQRDVVYRNAFEVESTHRQIVAIAAEMVNSPSIYPNPTGAKSCTKCQFRAPCIAADDGSDWQMMLVDGYEVNRGR